ncbi:hypothetical protein CBS101457_004233 [Exobasidium rhododendri]|nr:hypothetical protein CBS101457_004233 [Exobasidium rhododendri]
MSTSTQQQHPWHAAQKGPPTLASVAKILSSSHLPSIDNVVLLVGSGVSVAAGLPDFRSPKTGLYANLKKYDLPYPEAIFDIDFFQDNPQPFFTFSKELFPGNFKPTLTHTFFTLLNEKKKLLRCFTQNIDTLERMAGLPQEKLVEAHGSFATSQCINCRTAVTDEWMREKVMSGKVAYCEEERCKKKTKGKGGLVKPDIVFFGEGLPSRFFQCIPDLQKAQLLIVLGTSLQVQPFASLIDRVPASCPRLLINLERVGEIASYGSSSSGGLDRLLGGMKGSMNESGFDFEGWTLSRGQGKEQIRDVFHEGRCDDAILELAEEVGWKEELLEKHRILVERIDAEGRPQEAASAEKSADTAAKKMAEDVKAAHNKEEADEVKGDFADSMAEQLGNLEIAGVSKEQAKTAGDKSFSSSSPSL